MGIKSFGAHGSRGYPQAVAIGATYQIFVGTPAPAGSTPSTERGAVSKWSHQSLRTRGSDASPQA
jgi:hypothetical protein